MYGPLVFVMAMLASAQCTVHFLEEFNDGDAWENRWVQSEHYSAEQGKFVLSHGKFYGDAEKDMGVQTSQDARFYGISANFKPVSNEGKTLVVQFTVKHEQDIDCGGGYVKVFGKDLNQKDMFGDSEYSIMFGPDICGPGTKKVHVIFNYKGKNHLIKKDIRCKDDVLSHVYTLILEPDNTYKVLIDNEKAESGTLEEDWDMLPAKMIKDPEASKPDDWDEREQIDDPEDTQPEDWEKPAHIPDPSAKKPDDWDDEMDGEWEAPQIDNPEYKGEWKAKQIANPAYKGKWVHPEIENPEYTPDTTLYKFDDLSNIGLDLWQVKSGTIFDNVLICDDAEFAAQYTKDNWESTRDGEKKMKEAFDEEERIKREAEEKQRKEEEDAKKEAGEGDEEEESAGDDEEMMDDAHGGEL